MFVESIINCKEGKGITKGHWNGRWRGAGIIPKAEEALKEETNVKAGLLSRMRCRLHGTRDGCGPQDSGGSQCGPSRSFPLGSQQNSWEAVCWGRGPPGLPQEAAHWPLCLSQEQKAKHTNPKEKPLPLAVSLQCPLLTNLKLHQLAKEKCFRGPAPVSQNVSEEVDSEQRRHTDDWPNCD